MNGGFEDPQLSPVIFKTIPTEVPTLTDWSIGKGSIDLIQTYWPAHSGTQSIDLDGSGAAGTNQAATLSQMLPTAEGKTYDLQFYYSANPDTCGPATPQMEVLWNGTPVSGSPFEHERPAPFTSTDHSATDMNWTEGHATVLATGESELTFASLDDASQCGIALDDVSVTEAAPKPAPGVPTLSAAVAEAGVDLAHLSVSGRFTANPSESGLSVRLFTNANCDSTPIGTKTDLDADSGGTVNFTITDAFTTVEPGTSVSAESNRGGDWSDCSPPFVVTAQPAPGAPQLFGAVPALGTNKDKLGVAGVFTAGHDETGLALQLFASAGCAPGTQVMQIKTGLKANAQGYAAFAVDDTFPTLNAPNTFVFS